MLESAKGFQVFWWRGERILSPVKLNAADFEKNKISEISSGNIKI